uniref:Transposase n=1 Tax=Acrobeloides nanus TaxID=290746 RepID=A0A914C8Z6_9BILA
MTKDLRPNIIRAHEKEKGVREIARFLDISPATVSRAIKRFEETGSNKDRERKDIDDFPKRLAACIAANGGCFE